MARIFISYKRTVEPDEPLALALYASFKGTHEVFIDQDRILLGQDWVRRIRDEIEAADFLVVLLSENSIQSQMVAEEIRMAEKMRAKTAKPDLLPIRVGFEGALPYDLGAILNPLHYALWRSPADNERIVAEVRRALEGDQLTQSAPPQADGLPAEVPLPSANPVAALEAPGGTMWSGSPFYIERPVDAVAKDEQSHPAYTLTIKGPRQMGKSSLLGRVIARAGQKGTRAAFLDLQAFGGEALRDPQQFYPQFCFLIEDGLGLDSRVEEFWKPPIAPPQKCRRLLEKHVLPVCGEAGLLLAIDEADSMLDSPVRSDFFGMLRSWVNLTKTSEDWKRFSLAMAISTEPGLLIDNLSQSPFNVGITLELRDFTAGETQRANELHGGMLDPTDLTQLQELLGGHPYLTRRALYIISKERYTPRALLKDADSESGPFGDHLRALLARLMRREDMCKALRAALKTGQCEGEARFRLIAGGLLREQDQRVVARNELYRRYFAKALGG